MQMTPDLNPSSRVFKEVIIETTYRQGRVLEKPPLMIELGEYAGFARRMIGTSLGDPKKRETFLPIYLDSRGSFDNGQRNIIGDPINQELEFGNVDSSFPKLDFGFDMYQMFSQNRFERQRRVLGFIPHAHGIVDCPTSPNDLLTLLLRDLEVTAATASFVTTHTENIIILRGSKTPQFSIPGANELINSWMRDFNEKYDVLVSTDPEVYRDFLLDWHYRWLPKVTQDLDLKFYRGHNQDDKVYLNNFPKLLTD